MSKPFHLAFSVDDLDAARHFYGTVLGCAEGRSSETWIDFDLYGNQIVTHKVLTAPKPTDCGGAVDGHNVPIPHFGVVMDMESWHVLAARMKAANVRFGMEPYVRFQGQPGEQATMFVFDPAGNALEFKAFKDISSLFEKN
ncbi:VOC family protein [Gluconacetobacter tumulisoli]|uniref:VOC family protein n=1 Tax=Gluconacetobacter tumulisoli TaxID=1286189 RepID=A0A7W4K9Y0_9PROT|nr:VOC family protein [Gluconacetobacter tumulisoli]MBB2203053.1 VOC family protein [Gluconacetobacter tumulisoli]